jgi:ribonuclease HII
MDEFFCGIDEVGRGSLAGPIMAAAALFYCKSIYAASCPIADVRDSKKYTREHERRAAFTRILHAPCLIDFGVGRVEVEEINEMGINKANALVFQRAVADLESKPDFVLVDGVCALQGWPSDKQAHLPKADSLWWPVSAASVIAKVIRDELMVSLGLDYPEYRWNQNAGYGTPDHRDALKKYGPSPHHRRQFIKKITGVAA